ncbi:MAG: penicillin-binding protein 2 [Clostridiales bacterium]|jgi:peptidoglycan glycosyltransferase|nr:penicillin-binding protein 2 [Clostridiales bacterium]
MSLSKLRVIFIFFCVIFSLCVVRIVKFTLIDSRELVSSPYNKRLATRDERVVRGAILDRNGAPLAQTDEASGAREYPLKKAGAAVTGFAGAAAQGAEGRYAFELTRVHNELLARARNLIDGSPIRGNSVELTIDAGLQKKAYELMDGRRGAFMAMETATGRVLAMVSNPSFDPSEVPENWDQLSGDTEGNPLLNRAAQGLYPPGSTFKLVTALAGYDSGNAGLTYVCKGEEDFGGNKIHCINKTAHGEVDMKKAFAVSCNCYFAVLAREAGYEAMDAAAERFLFNKPLPFDLPTLKSGFALDGGTSAIEAAQTAIGQGRTTASPAQMLCVVSAAANDGLLMRPYLLDSVASAEGKRLKKILPKQEGRILTSEESLFLRGLCEEVTENGTGKSLKGTKIAGKTGTAENKGADHGWFVCYAPADEPKIAAVVFLENAGGSKPCLPIAGKWLEYALGRERDKEE